MENNFKKFKNLNNFYEVKILFFGNFFLKLYKKPNE